MSDILLLIIKDFRVEFRTQYAFFSACVTALSLMFMAALPTGGYLTGITPGLVLFWMVLFFSVTQFLSRLFSREESEGTSVLLRLRYDADSVFIAKAAVNCIVSVALSVLTLALFMLFFQLPVFSISYFAAFVVSAGISLAAALSLGGAISAKGGKSGLFGVISVPASIPVLLVSIRGSIALSGGNEGAIDSIIFNLSYAAVVFCVSLFLFRYLYNE